MFSFCTDPATLSDLPWMACYLTTGKHLNFYAAFGTVLLLLAITAPAALAFGFAGAAAARSRFAPLSLLGKTYIAIVRGVPDIVFFLFFVIALNQGIEWITHQIRCPDWTDPIRNGLEFRVCPQAKVPLNTAAQIWHSVYGFVLAVILTVIPFWLVMGNVFESSTTTALLILAFMVVQIFVHMVYFLHMNFHSEGGWNMLALIFTLVLVFITLAGSLWVMISLNANMMPGMM